MRHIVAVLFVIIAIAAVIYLGIWFSHFEPTSDICEQFPEIMPRVVVSFSTIPSRMKNIPDFIKSLESQTFIPDAIYFNLPYKSIREGKEYPDFVVPDTFLNVIVNRCEDIGPLTKLLPTLEMELDPNCLIITLDDDIIYKDYVFEKLVKAMGSSKKTVYSFGGWRYSNWLGFNRNILPFYTIQGVEHIIHGVAGVAYRRKFFGDDFHSIDECFTCDDVLISTYLSIHGITMIKLNDHWYKRRTRNDITLFSVNLKEWPYPECIRQCKKKWCGGRCIGYDDKICYPGKDCEKL